MDLLKILEIKCLVDDIRKTNSIPDISDSIEKLYKEIQPLTSKYSISEIINAALAGYNSIMCYPEVFD